MQAFLRLLALAAVLGLPWPAAAQAPPYFPQTLPPNTVVGRLGGGHSGPAEAIPFATLGPQLLASGAVSITLNPGNGISTPGAMSLGNTYTLGATTDTPQFTALGLGGVTPGTGLLLYNAAVSPTANGQASHGASGTAGAVIMGQGSASDVALENTSGQIALSVATGTKNVSLFGTLTAASLSTAGTIGGALCATSAGLVLYESGVNCFSASGVTVGTTTVTGGSNTQILFNNAGVLGSETTVPVGNLPVGTAGGKGILQGDGSTLTISSGVISCTTATISQIGCVEPDNTTITIAAGVITAVTSAASSIVVGTTNVTSGSNGFILYDNAGKLGNLGVTGSAGTVVLSSSPTLSGTIGGNLTWSGTQAFNGNATFGAATTVTFPDTSTWTSSALTHVAAGAQEIWNTTRTIASSANAVLDDLQVNAETTTVTGTTGITRTKGFNKVSLYQPTLTDSSSETVTNAATLYVEAPTSAGSLTITNPYAITVGIGNVNFPGSANVLGTITSGTWNGTVIGATFLPTATSGALGVVQGDGSTLTISAGVISCTTATSSQIGCSKPDNTTITVSAGVLTAVGSAATSIAVGTTTISSGTNGYILYNNAGVLGNVSVIPNANLPTATSGAKGIVQGDGSTLTISAGTISCTTATTSQIGCVEPDGTTITVSSGIITAVGAAASSIAVGTTTISAGTTNQILYDNGGTLGNNTIASFLTSGTGINVTGTTNATIAVNQAAALTWTGAQKLSGGFLCKRRTITSGASDSATATDCMIVWDKASGSASAETIPGCVAGIDGQLYVVKDEKGDAFTNNITVTPSSGTIEGGASAVMNGNSASITIQCDGNNTNWMVI